MVLARLLTAVALLAIAVPTAAAAAPSPRAAGPAPLALAAAVAGRYWGATPCHGQTTIKARQAIPAGLLSDSDAWVTFTSALGANDLAAPASSYARCTVDIGGRRWPTRASMVQDWDMLCTTVTHEFGHLLGHPHDTTPGSVMAPVFTDYTDEPQACRVTRPAGTLR